MDIFDCIIMESYLGLYIYMIMDNNQINLGEDVLASCCNPTIH